jgi:hypothetical protein
MTQPGSIDQRGKSMKAEEGDQSGMILEAF